MKYRKLVASLIAVGALVAGSTANAADPTTIARQKIFGIENVDANTGAVKKDKIVFSWVSHITGAVAVQGRVIMFDTYVIDWKLRPGDRLW